MTQVSDTCRVRHPWEYTVRGAQMRVPSYLTPLFTITVPRLCASPHIPPNSSAGMRRTRPGNVPKLAGLWRQSRSTHEGWCRWREAARSGSAGHSLEWIYYPCWLRRTFTDAASQFVSGPAWTRWCSVPAVVQFPKGRPQTFYRVISASWAPQHAANRKTRLLFCCRMTSSPRWVVDVKKRAVILFLFFSLPSQLVISPQCHRSTDAICADKLFIGL